MFFHPRKHHSAGITKQLTSCHNIISFTISLFSSHNFLCSTCQPYTILNITIIKFEWKISIIVAAGGYHTHTGIDARLVWRQMLILSCELWTIEGAGLILGWELGASEVCRHTYTGLRARRKIQELKKREKIPFPTPNTWKHLNVNNALITSNQSLRLQWQKESTVIQLLQQYSNALRRILFRKAKLLHYATHQTSSIHPENMSTFVNVVALNE